MNDSSSQSSHDFFELFSLESQYEIDLSQLKNRFREMQIEFHPDQYATSDEAKKIAAVKMSSLLNDAFEVLANPVKRAKYLLEKFGVDLQKDRSISQNILIEQMALREELEEINQLTDVDRKEESLEELHERLESMFKNCDDFLILNARGDMEKGSLIQELKQVLSRMLFINKLKVEVETAIENCDRD